MEQQPNKVKAETITNEKLATLQRHLAAIASGERQDASDISPHDVGVEGMYNIRKALLRANGEKSSRNEELRF